MRFGDLFRLAQRVDRKRGSYVVLAETSATEHARLHFEICDRGRGHRIPDRRRVRQSARRAARRVPVFPIGLIALACADDTPLARDVTDT